MTLTTPGGKYMTSESCAIALSYIHYSNGKNSTQCNVLWDDSNKAHLCRQVQCSQALPVGLVHVTPAVDEEGHEAHELVLVSPPDVDMEGSISVLIQGIGVRRALLE